MFLKPKLHNSAIRDLEKIFFQDFNFESGLDHPNPEWLQFCPLSITARGDILALAYEKKLGIISKNSKKEARETLMIFEKNDIITAVICIPVKNKNNSVWNCCIIGFKSGIIEVISADKGEILITRSFHHTPVVSIRPIMSNSNWPENSVQEHHYISVLIEVLIVYEKCIYSLNNKDLYDKINMKKSKLDEFVAQDMNVKETPIEIIGKKFTIHDQHIKDASFVKRPNVIFDQMTQLSLNSKINPTYLKSIGFLTSISTVGSQSFVQFNIPENYEFHGLNDIAGTILSTVTSGLYKAATDFIWGTTSKNIKKSFESEQKLKQEYIIKDEKKIGFVIEKTLDNRYVAIVDNQNRILVLDSHQGIVVNIWKGYHHAQIGWITVQNHSNLSNEIFKRISNDPKLVFLLAIYLPRRGTLQLFSVERKTRLAEFTVGKYGRLLQAQPGILEPTQEKNNFFRIIDTCFLDSKGSIYQIFVPLTSVVNISVTSKDLLKQQELLELLNSENVQNKAIDISHLIIKANSSNAKVAMILDTICSPMVSQSLMKEVVKKISVQLIEHKIANKSIFNCLEIIQKVIDLFDFVNESMDKLEYVKYWGDKTDKDFLTILFSEIKDHNQTLNMLIESLTESNNYHYKISLSSLARFLNLPIISFESNNIKITSLNENMELLEEQTILIGLCIAAFNDIGKIRNFLRKLKIFPYALIKFSLKVFSHECEKMTIKILHNFLPAFFNILFETNDCRSNEYIYDMVHSISSTLQMNSSLFFFFLRWKEFVNKRSLDRNKYLPEANRYLYYIQSFLIVDKAFLKLLNNRQIETKSIKKYTFEEFFNKGNGIIAEIIAGWLAKANITDEHFLKKDKDLEAFMQKFREVFPKNASPKIIYSHLAWENFRCWTENRAKIYLLERGFHFLQLVPRENSEELYYVHRFSSLIFQTFLDKILLEAANVTETRNISRCIREIGVPYDELHKILKQCCKLVGFIIETEVGNNCLKEKQCSYYDEVSSEKHNGLLEYAMNVFKMSGNSDHFELRYQFGLVIFILLRFKFPNKPFSFFNHQSINNFFHGSINMSNLGLSSITQNQSVEIQRKIFLEATCGQIVKVIHRSPLANYGVENFDTMEYEFLYKHLIMLEKIWHIEIIRICVIVSLYREGYDYLGECMLKTLSIDESLVASQLLYIAKVRLTKYIYEHEDHCKLLVFIKSELKDYLHQLQSEAKKMCHNPLIATKVLLCNICQLPVNDEIIQSAIECLSLTQSFLDRDMRKLK